MKSQGSKHIRSDNISILPSMAQVTPVSFDSYAKDGRSSNIFSSDPCSLALCSSKPSEKSDSLAKYSKAGYVISHFVERFIDTDAGQIPVVGTKLNFRDRLETVGARCGITRNNYKVTPGLYALGEPDENSEILVTANFKLTFDILRTSLHRRNPTGDTKSSFPTYSNQCTLPVVGEHSLTDNNQKYLTISDQISVWILVLETFGVNVWCAAGKGTFSTQELVRRVLLSGVEKVVKHRRLILPQLSAIGIRATDVKNLCGFTAIYGPVRAADIPLFLQNNRKASPDMRHVTFNFAERLILTPIELNIALKPVMITALTLFAISGICPEIFSFQSSWERGLISLLFLFTGLFSGGLVTPALLPFLPFKAFAAKGLITGAFFASCTLFLSSASSLSISAIVALFLFSTVVSSWLAMNFTGATPFTSPSGVEKEMKRFIPVQAGATILSLVLWIYSAF